MEYSDLVNEGTTTAELNVLGLQLGKKTSKDQHYVDNERLSAELGKWKIEYDRCKAAEEETPRLPEYVGFAIQAIANKVSGKYNFRNYSFRADMVSDAVVNIVRYIHNFDPNVETRSGKPNPFAYITKLVHHNFTATIGNEEEQTMVRMRLFGKGGGFDQLNEEEGVSAEDFRSATGIASDFQDKVAKYDEKIEKRKLAAKEKRDAKRAASAVEQDDIMDFLE